MSKYVVNTPLILQNDEYLHASGGSIVSSRGTENYQDNSKFSLLGITICEATNGPRAIIQVLIVSFLKNEYRNFKVDFLQNQ